MENIILDSSNLIKECFLHKYFTEEMPPSFSSEDFVEKIDKILSKILTSSNNYPTTYCTNLSIYKSEYTRRTISLPNPYSYLQLLRFLSSNWKTVLKLSKSSNSTSPIFSIGDLSSYTFDESRKIRCKCFFGYKYRLKIDLSNFYNSIYTHSLTWALVGKEESKKYIDTKNKKISNKTYIFADQYDKLMRKCKGLETNGIIIGPFASRIFSELLLSGIDKILRQQYQFVRFVDDYNFYFRTKQDAENSLSDLYQIFNEYNLTLNKEKISIDLFPFENYYDFNSQFNSMIKKDGAESLLRYALSLFEKGQKGALKYALKVIKSEHINQKNAVEIASYLINIMMVKPDLSSLCLKILKNKIIKLNIIKKVINEEIPECIKAKKQQELLWFLYSIITLQINIDVKNITMILESGDDFSRILSLDIIKNHKTLIYGTNIDSSINEALKILSNQFLKYDFYGEHWLLLYENYINKYISSSILDYNKVYNKRDEMSKFFQFLKKENIEFYKTNK